MWLAHHGILGQKWGVRRFQNEDGSLTAEGKERYRTAARITIDPLKEPYAKQLKQQLKDKGLVNLDSNTDIFKKGSEVRRLTATSNEPIDERRKYASFLDVDNDTYNDLAGALGGEYPRFADYYELTKDVKVATTNVIEKELIDNYGNESSKEFIKKFMVGKRTTPGSMLDSFIKENSDVPMSRIFNLYKDFSEINSFGGNRAVVSSIIRNPKVDEKIKQELYYSYFAEDIVSAWTGYHLYKDSSIIDKSLIKKGYDACIDYQDWIGGGIDYPIIFLNPKESLKFKKEIENDWWG